MLGIVKKIGMTRLFVEGKAVSVTVLLYPEQTLLQKKSVEKDGYKAIQVGVLPKKRSNKSVQGHSLKHSGVSQGFTKTVEFKFKNNQDMPEKFNLEDFQPPTRIKITGTTKGKGFTGVVKRYNFRGQPASHGHDHVRAVGSIGCRWPQRVLPGTRMAGRGGGVQRTVSNLKVLAVDNENQLLFVAGSVPGANGGLLKISKI